MKRAYSAIADELLRIIDISKLAVGLLKVKLLHRGLSASHEVKDKLLP